MLNSFKKILLVFIILLVISWFVPIVPVYEKYTTDFNFADCKHLVIYKLKDLIYTSGTDGITIWKKKNCEPLIPNI